LDKNCGRIECVPIAFHLINLFSASL
jgi:hypothetical protein